MQQWTKFKDCCWDRKAGDWCVSVRHGRTCAANPHFKIRRRRPHPSSTETSRNARSEPCMSCSGKGRRAQKSSVEFLSTHQLSLQNRLRLLDHLATFDAIFAVDTNTKVLFGRRISVTVVIQCKKNRPDARLSSMRFAAMSFTMLFASLRTLVGTRSSTQSQLVLIFERTRGMRSLPTLILDCTPIITGE